MNTNSGGRPRNDGEPRLMILANFSQASDMIRYRWDDEPADTEHQTVFQVADARHKRDRARRLVRAWLESGAG